MPPAANAAQVPASKSVRKPLWSDAEDSDDEPIRSAPVPPSSNIKPQNTTLDQRTTAPKPTVDRKVPSPVPPKVKDPDEWMEFGWNGWTKVYRNSNLKKLAEEEAKKAALISAKKNISHLEPPTLNPSYIRKRQKLNLSLADLEEKDDDDEWKEDDEEGKKNKKRKLVSEKVVGGGRDLVKETARQWGTDYDDVGGHIGETVKSRTRKAAPKTMLDFD